MSGTDELINLNELVIKFWTRKWIIVGITFLFAVLGIVYSLSLPNIYKSEVVLIPVEDNGSLHLPSQIGGLASLAGINVGSGQNSKTKLALEILKSRDFIGRFIKRYDLYVPLLAAEGWNENTNTLLINNDVYDEHRNKWIGKPESGNKYSPNMQEAYRKFLKLMEVKQNGESGVVTITIEHYSPFLAQKWATLVVEELNHHISTRESLEAQESIVYLKEQLSETNLSDMKSMLFSLIEEQTKTIMLTNVRDEYVFSIIDPAIVPDLKSKPNRAIIVVVITMLGLLLGMITVLLTGKKEN